MVRAQRNVFKCHGVTAGARSLPVPHALQPGHFARRPGRCLEGRSVISGSARRVATVRAPLPPVPRARRRRMWLEYVFAKVFGIDVRLDADTADHYFDAIGAKLLTPELPAARALRALQHRGDRHHRITARHARASSCDPCERLARPRHHRLSPGPGDRRGARRVPGGAAEVRGTHRRGRLRLARLSRRTPQAPRGVCRRGRNVDRSRPSDRDYRRPLDARRGTPVRAHRERRTSARPTPSCSAPRC